MVNSFCPDKIRRYLLRLRFPRSLLLDVSHSFCRCAIGRILRNLGVDKPHDTCLIDKVEDGECLMPSATFRVIDV